jgi:hypothetical protein
MRRGNFGNIRTKKRSELKLETLRYTTMQQHTIHAEPQFTQNNINTKRVAILTAFELMSIHKNSTYTAKRRVQFDCPTKEGFSVFDWVGELSPCGF